MVLESQRVRALSGRVAVDVDGREAAAGDVDGLKLDQPRSIDVALPLPKQPGASPLRITFDHDRWTERRESAVIRAGSPGLVRVSRERDGDLELVRLDNGRAQITLIPGQVGRIVHWKLDGVDQLHSSYPSSRLFSWFNPWFGGMAPFVMARESTDWRGRLHTETFGWRETSRRGAGIDWTGITVWTEPKSSGLRGLRIETSYLTCPDSNLIAVVTGVESRAAFNELHAGFSVWPAPGGDPKGVTLHYLRDDELNLKRVPGGMQSTSRDWCAVEPTGDGPTIALIAATPGSCVTVHDLGTEGLVMGTRTPLALGPGESREDVGYVVLAKDLTEARLYRALSEVGELV